MRSDFEKSDLIPRKLKRSDSYRFHIIKRKRKYVVTNRIKYRDLLVDYSVFLGFRSVNHLQFDD